MDVETSLFCIAEAMTIQFPRHISTLPPTHPRLHSFIVPAIINEKMYIYSVDLRRLRNNADYTYEVNQQMLDIQDKVISCPIYAAGSGAVALGHLGNWERPLLRMIQAYDNGKIGGSIVADEFAKLNQCIAKKDKWVGDRCIVAWANSKSGRYQGGGDYQYYTGRNRDLISHGFPSLWTGTDLGALAGIFDAMFDENLRRGIRWPQAMEFDSERIKKRLSELPNRPDEELR